MRRWAVVCVVAVLAVATPAALADPALAPLNLEGDRAIEYVGAIADLSNLQARGLGGEGWWLPNFDASRPVTGAPTWADAADALPPWVEAFNHIETPTEPGCDDPSVAGRPCSPTYNFRTFSQDGPARSAGGQPGWAPLRLPDGRRGKSGAIVDPHTAGSNKNNTINRIQLTGDVPSSFFVGVLVDNTAGAHALASLVVRGSAGRLDVDQTITDTQVEPPTEPRPATANGEPDVYVFAVRNFVAGDYLKVRLSGRTEAGAFGGLLFDAKRPGSAW